MDKAQIFLYMGNILYLSSYLVKGIFLLRILSIVGGLALMGYYFLVSGGPLWEPVVWGIAFFLINAIQLFLLFKSRKPVRLSPEEYDALQMIDPSLDHKLYREWTTIASIQKDQGVQKIDDRSVALVLESDGTRLINAIGFVDPVRSDSNTYELKAGESIFTWNINELKTLLNKLPELRTFWQQLVNDNLLTSTNHD